MADAAAKTQKFTTRGGLLYRDGKVIHLPEADSVAFANGYSCAEEFVRALKARAKSAQITNEQKELLREFVRTKRKAAEAASFIEKNKAEVLSIVRLLGGRAVYLNGALFEGASVSYNYPPAFKRREEKLKEEKKIMQLDGRAEKVVKPCLMFEDLAGREKEPESTAALR